MRSTNRYLALTALLAAGLLAGCGGSTDDRTDDATDGPVFDVPHTFDSGWVVTISSPTPVDGEGDTYMVEVTVENGTETEHNPTYDFVEVHADGDVAGRYFDRDAGIDGPPDVLVAPGEQERFGVGFLAQELETVEVVVSSTVTIPDGGETEEATFRAAPVE